MRRGWRSAVGLWVAVALMLSVLTGVSFLGRERADALAAAGVVTSVSSGGARYRFLGEATGPSGDSSFNCAASDTLKTSTGTTLGSISYRYDNNDNVTTKTTTGFAGAATNTYTYDLTNRLTSWNNGATTTSYGYDASGNRTSAGSTTYTYNARNQLLGDGTKTYTYTARGTQASVTQGTTTSPLTFDAYGQLATQAGASYSYDALGRMVSTTANSHTTTLSYSGTSNTLTSTNGEPVTVAHAQATPGAADRWDLTVDTDHDFYVYAGADAALVHNCSGTYSRPSGYRAGVRDAVWEDARETATGQIRDPLTGRFMSKDASWDMDHFAR